MTQRWMAAMMTRSIEDGQSSEMTDDDKTMADEMNKETAVDVWQEKPDFTLKCLMTEAELVSGC